MNSTHCTAPTALDAGIDAAMQRERISPGI